MKIRKSMNSDTILYLDGTCQIVNSGYADGNLIGRALMVRGYEFSGVFESKKDPRSLAESFLMSIDNSKKQIIEIAYSIEKVNNIQGLGEWADWINE